MDNPNLFDLDPANLDTEWLRLPNDYHTWARNAADRKADYGRSKAKKDVLITEAKVKKEMNLAYLDREIRKDPAKFGAVPGPRGITEDIVKNTIVLQLEYHQAEMDFAQSKFEAEEAVVEAEKNYDYSRGVVDALEHKKKALENLVVLHGRDYFSTPRVPIGADGEVREYMKQREIENTFTPAGTRKGYLHDD
jgi:hypothetical protein